MGCSAPLTVVSLLQASAMLCLLYCKACVSNLHACWNGAVFCAQDVNLRHTLQFGIGLHHAGLGEADRTVVEQLFVGGKIQVPYPAELFVAGC